MATIEFLAALPPGRTVRLPVERRRISKEFRPVPHPHQPVIWEQSLWKKWWLEKQASNYSMKLPIRLILTTATHSGQFLPSCTAGVGQPFGGGQKLLKKAMTRELQQQELLSVIYIQPILLLLFLHFGLDWIWYGMVWYDTWDVLLDPLVWWCCLWELKYI